MPLRVAISGVTSCENRGVEALVRSIALGLSGLGECRITVLTQTPAYDEGLLATPGFECVADPFVASRAWSHARPTEPGEAMAARADALLASTDLLVTTGGDLHTADYGVSRRYLTAPLAASQRGVRVAMLAHTVGPFTEPADVEAFADAARGCAVLTVRESGSLRYLASDLGLTIGASALAADPAFLLPAADRHRVDQLLKTAGVDPRQPYLCLAPSRGIAGFRDLEHAQHNRALLRLVDTLHSVWRLPVLLLPHVHDSRPSNDDRILVAELARAAGTATVRPLIGPLTASEYKGIVARATLLVAERLHAAIGGLSSGVATIAIGYSQKYLGVLADTYGPTVAVNDTHLDIATFVRNDAAADRLVMATDTERLRNALAARLPLVRDRACANFALVDAAMRGGHA
jgi:colanic acid/amylovoran biosynthesis protein